MFVKLSYAAVFLALLSYSLAEPLRFSQAMDGQQQLEYKLMVPEIPQAHMTQMLQFIRATHPDVRLQEVHGELRATLPGRGTNVLDAESRINAVASPVQDELRRRAPNLFDHESSQGSSSAHDGDDDFPEDLRAVMDSGLPRAAPAARRRMLLMV